MGLYDVINYFNYTPTNSSIDVVVIEQPDGTLKASPFHVNFGFGSVLRAEDRKVFIFGKIFNLFELNVSLTSILFRI